MNGCLRLGQALGLSAVALLALGSAGCRVLPEADYPVGIYSVGSETNLADIAGAGLDVMEMEPPPTGHPLYSASNCHITPHIGWATQAARRRLIGIAVENVKAFLEGHPQNVVNADQLA